jgi:MYXO-CTERM domain-containing protein
MSRRFGSLILALSITALPISLAAQQPGSMTGSATDPQTPGSGRTYGEVNRPDAPGYDTADRNTFDLGWLGLLGLAGLIGRRHTHRDADVPG